MRAPNTLPLPPHHHSLLRCTRSLPSFWCHIHILVLQHSVATRGLAPPPGPKTHGKWGIVGVKFLTTTEGAVTRCFKTRVRFSRSAGSHGQEQELRNQAFSVQKQKKQLEHREDQTQFRAQRQRLHTNSCMSCSCGRL
uniref:Uncharacterized protein n=1 Tax=Oryzias latipes TaxID=8090 RepID=A0A3P9K7L1_ORYLA